MRLYSLLSENGPPWYGQWVVLWGPWGGKTRYAGKVKRSDSKVLEIVVEFPSEQRGQRVFMEVGRKENHLYMASSKDDAIQMAMRAPPTAVDDPSDPADWWKK